MVVVMVVRSFLRHACILCNLLEISVAKLLKYKKPSIRLIYFNESIGLGDHAFAGLSLSCL
jgi:hypothetical protein